LPKCQFTRRYADYEINKLVDFDCQEEPLDSGLCMFHDKDYLQDKTNNEEHKRKVLDRFKHKVNDAISNYKPLLCIGFQVLEFSISDLSNNKEFTKSVYFNRSQFFGKASFYGAHFQGRVDFSGAKFQGFAGFYGEGFHGQASSLKLICKYKQTLVILSSTAKHTSHSTSSTSSNSSCSSSFPSKRRIKLKSA
jgi:hypothetical protein